MMDAHQFGSNISWGQQMATESDYKHQQFQSAVPMGGEFAAGMQMAPRGFPGVGESMAYNGTNSTVVKPSGAPLGTAVFGSTISGLSTTPGMTATTPGLTAGSTPYSAMGASPSPTAFGPATFVATSPPSFNPPNNLAAATFSIGGGGGAPGSVPINSVSVSPPQHNTGTHAGARGVMLNNNAGTMMNMMTGTNSAPSWAAASGVNNQSFTPMMQADAGKVSAATSVKSHQQYTSQQQYSSQQQSAKVFPGGNLTTTGTVRSASHTLTSTGMTVSRLHHEGSRTGRWVTSYEGQVIEEQIAMGTLRIVGERIVEHEVRVPKKVVKEEQWEKVIVVPEKEVKEEIIEDIQIVREKIVEYAKNAAGERVVEVPEVEYVERVVEVPEKIIQEKIIEVPKIEVKERVIEIPSMITQEKVVEVPEIEYKEVLIEKFVEVPQVQEEIKVREVAVPQYIDKPYPEYVNVEEKFTVERRIPIPVEVETTWRLELPKLRPQFTKVKVPLYVPRFIEVPVPRELLGEALEAEANSLAEHVGLISQQQAISLCEVENVAAQIKKADFRTHVDSKDYLEVLKSAWASKTFAFNQSLTRSAHSMQRVQAPRHGGKQRAGGDRHSHKTRETKKSNQKMASKISHKGSASPSPSPSPLSGLYTGSPSQGFSAARPGAMALMTDLQNHNQSNWNYATDGKPFAPVA